MIRRHALLVCSVVTISVFAVACMRILGFRSGGGTPFPHRAHVLEGIACQRCHLGIETAGETGPLHLPTKETCVECHKNSHDSRPCGQCHGNEATRSLAAQARRYTRFQHVRHIARVRGNCVRCHSEIKNDGAVLRPRMATCLSCHPHKEQMETKTCDGCHIDIVQQGLRPRSHMVHDGDWVREHGVSAASSATLCRTCHDERFCASCHGATVPVLRSKLMFDQTVSTQGLHRAGFRSRHAEEARAQPGLCTTCHAESSCRNCHLEKGVAAPREASGSIHRAGWVGLPGTPNEHGRASWRNPAECAACHSGAGEALCVGCHKVGAIGGNPHAPGWSSRASKSDVPCRLCHTRGM